MRCHIFNPHMRGNVILWVGGRCVTELATHISIFIIINRSGDGCGRRGIELSSFYFSGGAISKTISPAGHYIRRGFFIKLSVLRGMSTL